MSDSVSDSIVRSIIDRTLSASRGKNEVERVGGAFRELQSYRQQIDPTNLNVAAAEHYLYARFLAGATGDRAIVFAPLGYELKKRIYFLLGIQERMAVTSHPPTPAKSVVTRWGRFGAEEGLKDYLSANPGKSLNFGGATTELWEQYAWWKKA